MADQTEIEVVGTEVVRREVQQPVALPEVNALMEMALQQGAEGVDALDRLVDMQMRILDRQAESALVVALAEFKAACPTIPKSKKIDYATKNGRRVKFEYAPLGAIQKVVDPELHKVGLSYTFDTEDQGDKIKIRGVLQHVDGATRESTVVLPVSGMQDSPAQKYAGTITYGKRYVLASLLGITIEDDVDGQQPGSPAEPIDPDELKDLLRMVDESGADTKKFCTYFKIKALADLPTDRLAEARRLLRAKGAK